MTSNKPDFKNANIRANEILVASSTIISFPVRAKRIIKEWTDISLVPFKNAHKFNVDIEAFGSESAVLHCKCGRYVIFYNDEEIAQRVKFSILHELGHYIFQHKLDKYKSREEYDKNEVEANCFAAQLLMPEQVINELKNRGAIISKEFLQNNFGVSEEAAEKRIKTLGKLNYGWRSPEEKIFDETILFKYSLFMDSILPKKNQYTMYEYDYEMQRERDGWDFDSRSRY